MAWATTESLRLACRAGFACCPMLFRGLVHTSLSCGHSPASLHLSPTLTPCSIQPWTKRYKARGEVNGIEFCVAPGPGEQVLDQQAKP